MSIRGIGQIAVAVDDLEAAVPFYRDALGLTLLFEAPPGLAFFDAGGVRLMITTPQGPENDHRTSVIYYRVDDLEPFCATLEARGVSLEREPHEVAKLEDHALWMAFVRDPAGNLIGLMQERPLAG